MSGVYSSKSQIVLQRCDFPTNWESAGVLTIDKVDFKEGIGSLNYSGNGTAWFRKVFSQTDVGVDATGYLKMWLYVSDVSAFTGTGQIEITSSGEYNIDEYSWPIATLGLTDGWNELILPIADAEVIGTPDLNAINYFRIHQELNSAIAAKLDFVRFSKSINEELPENFLDIKAVDNTTLDGKVMFGYQGWFATNTDGSPIDRWLHWGNLSTGSGNPDDLSVDMWFDDRELDPDELYETGYFYPDGRVARAFSSYNKKTVIRHMKWLRDYQLDGVFLQRFLSEARDEKFRQFRDSVTSNVMDGCERYDRVFSIMWDGINYGDNMVEELKTDWKHLVDDVKVTESPNYLHHRGRPLISLWGFSVRSEATVEQLVELIDFFHNNPEEKYRASIKVGCNDDWFTRPEWRDTFKDVEVVSPWTVGRYGDANGYENFANNSITPAQEWCDNNNVDFLPVNWPGFSWYNLHDGPKNQHKRDGANFFWSQVNGNLSRGAKSLYLAMFDEVDEATSFFKMPEDDSMSPDKGYWLALDADGYDLPSDWFLRSANLATEVTKGWTDNRIELGTPNEGLDVLTIKAIHETCDMANGGLIIGYPDTESNATLKYSIDGGKSYPYTTPASSKEFTISDLSAGLYNIWVSFDDDSNPTDLGDALVVNAIPRVTVQTSESSCLDNGSMNVRVYDNPYMGAVEISFDNGENYTESIADGMYVKEFTGFGAGTYELWAKFVDYECADHVATVTIDTKVVAPEAEFLVAGDPSDGNVCIGSLVSAIATSSNDIQDWSWTGPNGFSANSAEVVISESVSEDQLGDYTVEYTDLDGCKDNVTIELTSDGKNTPDVDFLVEIDQEFFDPDEKMFCEGDAMILEGRPDEGNWEWSWSGPNNFSKNSRRATLTASATPDKSGTYSLTVIDDQGCVGLITKEVIVNEIGACVTSLEDLSMSRIASVYPNPSNGILNIDFVNNKAVSIDILDVQGRTLLQQKVISEQSSQIDLSDFTSGVMFLRVIDSDGQSYVTRIIKE